MTRPPDAHQLAELFGEIRSHLDDLELGIPDRAHDSRRRWSLTAAQLADRARSAIRDGWRASSSEAQSKGGYGVGPVPALALAPDHPDTVAWRKLNTDLALVGATLSHAVRTLADATPENMHPAPLEGGCRVCSRRGQPEPVYRAERCRWCYEFWILWKEDPPWEIVVMRRQGKRITEADIRQALAA